MINVRDLYVCSSSRNMEYYTLYSLSVFSLAKSLKLMLEISVAYRLGSYLLTDNCLICRLRARCMISNGNININILATVCLSLFSSKQWIIKQSLDSVFVIS